MPQRTRLRLSRSCSVRHRSLATILQPRPPAQKPWMANAGGICTDPIDYPVNPISPLISADVMGSPSMSHEIVADTSFPSDYRFEIPFHSPTRLDLAGASTPHWIQPFIGGATPPKHNRATRGRRAAE